MVLGHFAETKGPRLPGRHPVFSIASKNSMLLILTQYDLMMMAIAFMGMPMIQFFFGRFPHTENVDIEIKGNSG